MEWTDQAIVLNARKHGENSLILSVLSQNHGRHEGLVRGGTSKRLRSALQPGNLLQCRWHARLEDHLGLFQVDLLSSYGAKALSDPFALSALQCLSDMAHFSLTSRNPCANIYQASCVLMQNIHETEIWPDLYLRWELGLLEELGFGLDFSKCAVTGQNHDLAYVSPKSGRAVSKIEGDPYKAKLFRLPEFLLVENKYGSVEDLKAAFLITGHFIAKHILAPSGREIPPSRMRFLDRLK